VQIENLDLVISVDTAVVHLAAALGKRVWMLDRFDPCWRWLNGRATARGIRRSGFTANRNQETGIQS
jgi:ADP-heptose:LPS heptosyltransferase